MCSSDLKSGQTQISGTPGARARQLGGLTGTVALDLPPVPGGSRSGITNTLGNSSLIDKYIFSAIQDAGVQHAEPTTDWEFIRRVTLDLTGRIGDAEGPGSTHSPITLAHATIEPGAQLVVPWDPRYCAMAYALSGSGRAGEEGQPFGAHQLAYFGDGDSVSVRADDTMRDGTDAFDVLLLGGLPIREPIVHYGPFVMNTKQEIIDAIDDFNAGRMGTIPT